MYHFAAMFIFPSPCVSLSLLWSIYSLHVQEHCLMGIKGTVRRSTDGHVIHANIDRDIIIAEEPTDGIFYRFIIVCISIIHMCVMPYFNDRVHKISSLIFSKSFFSVFLLFKLSSLFYFRCCHVWIIWFGHWPTTVLYSCKFSLANKNLFVLDC